MITKKPDIYVTDVPIGGYFRDMFDRKPSTRIYQVIGFDPEDGDNFITKHVANYWTYEKVWKEASGAHEDNHNPYDRVFRIDELPPFNVKMDLD